MESKEFAFEETTTYPSGRIETEYVFYPSFANYIENYPILRKSGLTCFEDKTSAQNYRDEYRKIGIKIEDQRLPFNFLATTLRYISKGKEKGIIQIQRVPLGLLEDFRHSLNQDTTHITRIILRN